MHSSRLFSQENNSTNTNTTNVSYIRLSAFFEELNYAPLTFLNYKVIRHYAFHPSMYLDDNHNSMDAIISNLDRYFDQMPVFSSVSEIENEYRNDDLMIVRYICEFELNKSTVEDLIKNKQYQTLLEHLKAVHPDERTKALLCNQSKPVESMQLTFNSVTFEMQQRDAYQPSIRYL